MRRDLPHVDRAWVAAGLVRERLELAGDEAHAVDKLGDALQVRSGRDFVTPIEKTRGVARKRAQCGERLVQFVSDAGRKLADHRQFPRLDQLVLGRPQRTFGAYPLGNFILKVQVGRRKVGGAFHHLVLKFVVCFLQGFSRRQPVPEVSSTIVDHHRQNEEQDGRDASYRSPAGAYIIHLFQVGKKP